MVAGICNDSSIAFPRVYAFWQYEGYNADRSDWYDVAAQSRRVWTVPYTQIEKAFGLHATSPYSFHLRTAAAHWENGAR
jgi:hypothetical protein